MTMKLDVIICLFIIQMTTQTNTDKHYSSSQTEKSTTLKIQLDICYVFKYTLCSLFLINEGLGYHIYIWGLTLPYA